jgi:transglutaminase-like putative cysteine protease
MGCYFEENVMSVISRREFLIAASAAALSSSLPRTANAQYESFNPQPGTWRTFELTTTIQILNPKGVTRVWVPVPSIQSDYQRSMAGTFAGNGKSTKSLVEDKYGSRLIFSEFDPNEATPTLEVVSTIQAQNRAVDWNKKIKPDVDPAELRRWILPTERMPTDGIVLKTATDATKGATNDVEQVRALYDWVVRNTYREPKVRGCGTGDIKTMLETGNLGGKCGDINALFVGLCRSLAIPARDVYGIRLVPSAFGYRELSGNPAKLQGAQHCRAEVFLRDYGWTAMDPADVGKVMRLETPEWIKDPNKPVAAPVYKALFGGWEGNWLGYNMAHDVVLPRAVGPSLAFFMYPQAENDHGRLDSLDPDNFKYTITAREIKA